MQQIIKFSMTLSVFSVFIFSFTYFGASAFSSRASTNHAFSEKTYIGNIDVSNKMNGEAKALIEAKVNEWAAAGEISLLYKGKLFSIDPLNFVFLIDESIASSKNGAQNVLLVELKEEALNPLSLPEQVISQLEKEKLVSELLAAGQGLVLSAEISLENYLPFEQPETISTAFLKLPAENDEVNEIVKAIQAIEIAPETQFSLANLAKDRGITDQSSYAYSQIASALYKAILSTNFTIAERHISSRLPENIELGFEAKVDFAKNLDLKFYNPNKTSYRIKLNWSDDALQVTITGAPLLYEYKITTSGKQEFKPRTIKQYSPLLHQGQKSVEREGEPGVLLSVSREIYGQKGELLETEFMTEDFYPPVHRVVIMPVEPAGLQTAPDTNGNPGTVTAPSAEQNNPVPGEKADSDTASPEESNDPSNQDENVEDEEDRLWGKPNEQPK